jgi:DUF4097 and DUF4098 domain-containing protein YvlB
MSPSLFSNARQRCALLFALPLVGCGLFAQTPTMSCRERNRANSFCEVRETTVASMANLNVDGRSNGGITIKGANRSDILVRAMVQTHAATDAEAKAQAAQILVNTSAGNIQASGPTAGNWSVSYEIFVPSKTNLSLKARNGGVSISGVESTIEFHSVNGGINLKDVGGYVHGETVNGGVSVSVSGEKWSGQGLDVSTTNGGVSMKVPEKFSATLDLGTVNGGVAVNLPSAPRAVNGKLNGTVGSGGPQIRIRTHNGGVSLSTGGQKVKKA